MSPESSPVLDTQPAPPAESYSQAVDELDRILEDLEQDDIDVDLLADRVRRAAELLSWCRSRITAATDDVEQAVASLAGETSTSTDDEPF